MILTSKDIQVGIYVGGFNQLPSLKLMVGSDEFPFRAFRPIFRVYVALGIQSPCQRMIGVYNHLLSKVFRFHCHSQKVIGSLGLLVSGLYFTSFRLVRASSLCMRFFVTGLFDWKEVVSRTPIFWGKNPCFMCATGSKLPLFPYNRINRG